MPAPAHTLSPLRRRRWLRTGALAALGVLVTSADAGDILRGGAASSTNSRRSVSSSANAGNTDATRAELTARDRLSRTTQAIQSVKALQSAARSAASNANAGQSSGSGAARQPRVTDGLSANGLKLAAGVPKNLNRPKKNENASLWVGAELPRQSSGKGGEKTVTIVQNEQQALLSWEKFNVGRKTTLVFDQSAGGSDRGKWIAFNQINDPSGRPSQILGSIKSDGQVYILNQNGIIFGGSSQINTRSLVAAALPINNNLVSRGLLDNPDAEFLFNALQTETLSGLSATTTSVAFSRIVDEKSTPRVTATVSSSGGTSNVVLEPGKDYTLATDRNRVTTLTLTPAGITKSTSTGGTETSYSVAYTQLNGDVIVERGAQLSAPTTAQKVGGRISLVGANVRNAGTISTPDGQTILAAGLQVGFGAHSSDDPSLRGLDTYVGAVSNPDTDARPVSAGAAVNSGLIDIPRASATIAGRSVQQNGVIDSTTSVELNGRIDLDATYDHVSNNAYDATSASPAARVLFIPRSSGVVTFGEGSVTRILPELSLDDRTTGTELPTRSQINARGVAVHFEEDSTVLAPNAEITVRAGLWNYTAPSSDSQPPLSEFVYTAGQIYADRGALIDVAGTTAVRVPQSESILTVELRSAELADSPLQRDGAIRGETITVDARITGTYDGEEWVGTPLGDVSGYLDLIERTAAQLTTAGGSVSFEAGNSVVLNEGSIIDVSGGWVRHEGGYVQTTKLRQGNRLIDIADATPDQNYDGIYDPKSVQTSAKWGVTKTYRNPLALLGGRYESDYIAGADGGSISLVAPAMALDGTLTGRTVTGPRQVRETATSSTAPKGASLSLTFRADDPAPRYGEAFSPTSPTPPRIVFDANRRQQAADPFAVDPAGEPLALDTGDGSVLDPYLLREDRRETLVLSPTLLTDGGFTSLEIDNSAGDIVVPSGVSLETAPGGSITLSGRNIAVRGDISAPGGSLSFTANNLSPYFVAQFKERGSAEFEVPVAQANAGRFTLAPGAKLSTAGRIVDERNGLASEEAEFLVPEGGDIKIVGYDVALGSGSTLDVSGGIHVTRRSEVRYGDAGSITVNAGRDPNLAALFPETPEGVTNPDLLLAGRLRLGAILLGYSGATGGSLALQAPFIQIGGRAVEAGTLVLAPEFFDQGGFTSFDLAGLGGMRFDAAGEKQSLPGLVIAEGAELSPRVRSLFVEPLGGADAGLAVTRRILPRGERPAVSLSFRSLGIANDSGRVIAGRTGGFVARGDLVMEEGVRITTDPGATVSFTGTTVALLGEVSAPAGVITITGSTDSVATFEQDPGQELATPTVYLGSKSRFSVAGTTVLTPDPYGRRIGEVLAGGSVTVKGNIVAAAGAVIDVSGATGVLDLEPTEVDPDATVAIPVTSGLNEPLAARRTVATRVDSDAGTITLTGGDQLFTDATLLGRAGGPTAAGGTLVVSSGRLSPNGSKPTDANLLVTQSKRSLPGDPLPSIFNSGEQTAIGRPVRNREGEIVPARGRFAIDTFTEGGFDSLTLGGVVRFLGPVEVNARGSLRVADGGVLYANDTVSLTAPYVALGKVFPQPQLSTQSSALFAGEDPGGSDGAYNFRAKTGPGRLIVRADLIDIGTLSLRNIRRGVFIAEDGDIRGAGTLNIAGTLRFRAGQIYTPTALDFTVVAYDYKATDARPGDQPNRGSVVIEQAGVRSLPLSAGGDIAIYASRIEQGGTIRTPMGTISLGWDGTGAAPVDAVVGTLRAMPVTRSLVLGAGSVTSVSAIDPATGEGVLIPYGVSIDGNSWIDPRGVDITSGGLPTKQVRLSATSVTTEVGSEIDLRGGGDLTAYRWVAGNGGTQDVLESEGSFAVIPGYDAGYAPYAPFNDSDAATNLARDPNDLTTRDRGYRNDTLQVGDQVTLGASDVLPAGTYTLLPARYALLPGAVLVTPKSGTAVGTRANADGSRLVSGVRSNGLGDGRTESRRLTTFEVAPAETFRARSQYDDFTASSFLRQSATELGLKTPVLPLDSGRLVFQATRAFDLRGEVRGRSEADGRDALIDISTPADILITDRDGAPRKDGTIVLNASRLSAWEAESLLVGGVRTEGETATTIAVTTGKITVDNRAAPLTGSEVLLAAREELTLARGARVSQTLPLNRQADDLLVDGDGVFLRVTADETATFTRTNVTTSGGARLSVGAGVRLSGRSLTLDSSQDAGLDARARFLADYIALSSGRISIQLASAASPSGNAGLVLAGRVLRDLQGVRGLSLLSYSSIDIYGAGRLAVAGSLALSAGEIRGFAVGSGVAQFLARELTLSNVGRGIRPGATEPASGSLRFTAGTITLGDGRLDINQYDRVELNASRGLVLGGRGSLRAQNDLRTRTPIITATPLATQTIRAGGDLRVLARGEADSALTAGLGASLTLVGASVTTVSDIVLPSGRLSIRARQGDVVIRGRLDVGGAEQVFNDLLKYTSAGEIQITADQGDVDLARGSVVRVSANPRGGDAGRLTLETPQGELTLRGTLEGRAGRDGQSGSFSLDARDIPAFSRISDVLDQGEFAESRTFRVREGDVVITDGGRTRNFSLSADQGSIRVTGKIDASGETGGSIRLIARDDLILARGAELTVAGRTFDNAGKGGSVLLEAGAARNGSANLAATLDIQAGSFIDLTVAAQTSDSALRGQFTGTLHLRAPQNATSTDLGIAAIDGAIRGASSIIAEGYKLFDLATTSGVINASVRNQVRANAETFLGAAGTTTANYSAMLARLLANNAGLDSVFTIRAGAELYRLNGSITLGSTTGTGGGATSSAGIAAIGDFDLATFRFGPRSAPGVLTIRASGNLEFLNALSDGFVSSRYNARLLDANADLPLNAQSWSYRLTAGADFSAADFRSVVSLSRLGADSGSLLLGRFNSNGTQSNSSNSNGASNNPGRGALTERAIYGTNLNAGAANRYQVIRTGSGDIEIFTGRDIQLRNHFATIYTAGVLAPDQTLGGAFDLPVTLISSQGASSGDLGAAQQGTPGYQAQYTLGGGNVILEAQRDIAHVTRRTNPQTGVIEIVFDSQRQMPTNWLYRRGYVDSRVSGFGTNPLVFDQVNGGFIGGDVTSTTWWVDFSNFFQGVGALGGGNVRLVAGENIRNVDAVVPTNARLPKTATSSDQLVELGGGDLVVRAGGDLDAGVYYVERGNGSLVAGDSIVTNESRSMYPYLLRTPAASAMPGEQTWLPTTLFLGKGRFDVSARGDVLLGPVANTFLLPQGLNNSVWYKTVFSTYASTSAVEVSSLGGDVTLRTGVTLPDSPGSVTPILQAWYRTQLLLNTIPSLETSSFYQPWLRLNEVSVNAYGVASGLLPPTMRVTSFSGDLNLVGNFDLSPSARGTVEFAAAGSINALQATGVVTVNGSSFVKWNTSRVNLSDASPSSIPGVTNPYAYRAYVGPAADASVVTRRSDPDYLVSLNRVFAETGAVDAVLQTRQTLHAANLLHAGDTQPLRLYALTGNISGLTLFSPKFTRIVAGQDITDNAFYLQNVDPADVSVVSSGRDIIAYNANSPLRSLSTAEGNLPSGPLANPDAPLAGDIQLSGPGVLTVLAGRNLDLGLGDGSADGTGAGITTVGNARNPYLPFAGASIVAGAGVGPSNGLALTTLDFESFIADFVTSSESATLLAEVDPLLTVEAFNALPVEQRNRVALEVFFRLLRDAGRTESTGGPGYASGYAAIDSLFPAVATGDEALPLRGNLSTRSRNIRTRSGGDISLIIPRGELTLANSTIGNPSAPPGIVTEAGGNISIFADGNVDIGIGRIFTLRGGDMIIWSSTGDIAAGAASKTVQSAPPTRVLIDPQSAEVQTDLAGLATGGGIGVLATVAGVEPGDVDLIAPVGVVDAGDAGIRVSGNLNIAATAVLNASNIAVAGSTSGVPSAPVVAAPNVGGLTSASTTAGAANAAADQIANQARPQPTADDAPSVITVEVLGYGGGEDSASL